MIYINGTEICKTSVRLCDYLKENGLNEKRIAVELNGEILPKAKYSDTTFCDGDRIEIVNFVGGG